MPFWKRSKPEPEPAPMSRPATQRPYVAPAPPPRGMIAAHGLWAWWTSTFTPAERDAVRALSLVGGKRSGPLTGDLDRNPPEGPYESTTTFFEKWIGSIHPRSPEDVDLARRIVAKGCAVAVAENATQSLHFLALHAWECLTAFKPVKPEVQAEAEAVLAMQVAAAPRVARSFRGQFPNSALPVHTGYSETISLLMERGDLDQALALCQDAVSQGWAGNLGETLVELLSGRGGKDKAIAICRERIDAGDWLPWERLLADLTDTGPWPSVGRIKETRKPQTLVAFHYDLERQITLRYRTRVDPKDLAMAVAACERQILLAPKFAPAWRKENGLGTDDVSNLPSHKGYEQLAIIREKDKDFAGAIALAEEAKAMGWAGDWDKRIARCRAKLA